jgi:nitroreductase
VFQLKGGDLTMTRPAFISSNNLIDVLRWRYATKDFDPTKKISDENWKALEEVLILTPSSYGLQPWKFFVVSNPAIRAQLKAHSWNQPQTVASSHFVVFAGRTDLTLDDLDRWVARMAEIRGVSSESLGSFRDRMAGDLVHGPRQAKIQTWVSNQIYIALGNFMTSAALLGIDTCPMEGIDPEKYDEVLDFNNSGYKTLVACAAGYRSAHDKYGQMPKIRYPKDQMIQEI